MKLVHEIDDVFGVFVDEVFAVTIVPFKYCGVEISSDDDRYFAFAFGFALRDVSVEVGPVFVIFRGSGWCIDIDDECLLFVSCFDGYGY